MGERKRKVEFVCMLASFLGVRVCSITELFLLVRMHVLEGTTEKRECVGKRTILGLKVVEARRRSHGRVFSSYRTPKIMALVYLWSRGAETCSRCGKSSSSSGRGRKRGTFGV
jgi:hypothetical protein